MDPNRTGLLHRIHLSRLQIVKNNIARFVATCKEGTSTKVAALQCGFALMLYCDVSLPVPLDQSFTYALPETLEHRAQPGCRVLVPFGARKLTGMVLRVSSERPAGPVKDVLRLLDEEPVLDAGLISLGNWIAQYYCAPLG